MAKIKIKLTLTIGLQFNLDLAVLILLVIKNFLKVKVGIKFDLCIRDIYFSSQN